VRHGVHADRVRHTETINGVLQTDGRATDGEQLVEKWLETIGMIS
jgi:hypothetical protein